MYVYCFYIVKSKTYSAKCCKFLNIENYFVLKGIIIEVIYDLLSKARCTSTKTALKIAKIQDDFKAKNIKMNRLNSLVRTSCFLRNYGHFIYIMKLNFHEVIKGKVKSAKHK